MQVRQAAVVGTDRTAEGLITRRPAEKYVGKLEVIEMIFIVGAICFILGGIFGVAFMCLFTASGRADTDMKTEGTDVNDEV